MVTRAAAPLPPLDQAALLDRLAAGEAFDGIPPRRIDTHAATVFLAGDRAWKLKHEVTFEYLDFSTIERRRAALEAELALNRRTAPSLYIAVHAVTREPDGALAIDGKGPAADWILEMRRFPDDATLDFRAERGHLDDGLVAVLADRLVDFHGKAEVDRRRRGSTEIRKVLAGNMRSFGAFAELFDLAEVEQLGKNLARLIDANESLLDERARHGRVRRAHGDLHLANIAVIEGEPVPFDCLEFDEDLATIDVLYDVAFLLMDLWQRGLTDEANLLFNRYLDLSPEDESGAALMPFFLSMRATILAHVTAARSERCGSNASLRNEAQRYLAAALGFLQPAPLRLVAVGGLSGTGKSSLARRLGGRIGRAPGARIVRSDVIRKRLAGLEPECRLPATSYSLVGSRRVYREVARLTGAMLQVGQSAMADAVFARRDERDAIEAVAAAARARFDALWLEAPIATLKARVGARGADASDADAAVVEAQTALRVGDLGSWRQISAAGSLDEVVAAAWGILSGEDGESVSAP